MATATDGLIERLRSELPGAIAEGDHPMPPGPKIDRANSVEAQHTRIAGPRSPEEESNLGDLPPARAASIDLLGPLDEETSSRMRGECEQYGLEALAWYSSYHWGIYRGWGIYLREVGILHAATEIASRQGGELESALRPARDLLVGHEMLHYYADVAATSLEIALGSPLYVPRHRRGQAPGYDTLEEALANAHALTRLTTRRTRAAAASWLSAGPIGYRDFAAYVNPDDWRDGVRMLMGSILSAGAGPPRGLPVLESLLDRTNEVVSEADVPVWLVHERGERFGLRFVTNITEIIETRRFQKQLQRGDGKLAKAWDRGRNRLAVDVSYPGLNFEKLKDEPDRYSVRLNRLDRAVLHLQDKSRWVAERVGDHDLAYR